MIRPTRRAVLIFTGSLPLALGLLVYDAALWPFSFGFGIAVLIAGATDAIRTLRNRGLTVKIATPPRLYVGERSMVVVELTASLTRDIPVELLLDQQGALDPPITVSGVIEPDHTLRAHLPLLARRRGRVTVERLWLRWRGPLGLVETTRIEAIGHKIDVLPNVRGVQSAALQFFTQESVFGIKVQQQRGEGAEFDSLRDYVPGHDPRFIDWKHSARHRKLLSKEFKIERNHHVVLSFDTGYLMREPVDGLPRLDHAINAALLLGWISLQSGDLVGTFGFDAAVRHYLRPVRGVGGFSRLLHATSELDYRTTETNFTLGLAELGARLKRRALVILFTDFVDTVSAELLIESMQRIARRHVVIFVTLRDTLLQRTIDAPPEVFTAVAEAVIAQDLLRERSIVLERLERIGIHCLDIPSNRLSVSLINRYLLIKERGLL